MLDTLGVRAIDFGLRIGNDAFDVVSAEIVEEMQGPSRARIVVACDHEPPFSDALATAATFELSFDGMVARKFVLRLASARFLGVVNATRRYALELFSPLWLLSLAIDTRKFRDVTTEVIVSRVLQRFDVAHAWKTTRKTDRRSWCVQYHETCLDFVQRLLEFEGIFSATDDEGVLVLGDASEAVPEAAPGSVWELLENTGSLSHGAGIHSLRRGARVASGAAAVADHDWKKPGLPLLRSAALETDGDLETFDYPAGYRAPEQGAAMAKRRVEEQRALARFVEGAGNVPAFAAAHRIALGPSAGAALAGEWLLVRVEHRLENPHHRDAKGASGPHETYRNQFVAIPSAVPFRPARRTPVARVEGCHTAMVRGPAGAEIHTDRHGRFKAQFHWDREAVGTDADSRWMRMLQESATSMTLARVGWELSVAYVAGDPDRPIGIARAINGEMPPTYGQPGRKNVMAMKSPSSPASGGYNELRLDDSKGAMGFHVRAEKDLMARVRHDKSERIGNDETHFVGGTLEHDVGNDQTVKVGADSSTKVNGAYDLQVGNDRTVSVGASEHVEVGAVSDVSVGGNDGERVGSLRLTIAGGVGVPSAKTMARAMVPTPQAAAHGVGMAAATSAFSSAATGGAGGLLGGAMGGAAQGLKGLVPKVPNAEALVSMLLHGSIGRMASKTVTRSVGGAFVSVAVGDTSTSAGLGYVETIGGAKISLSGGSITRKAMAVITTVGGLILRSSGKAMSRTAKTSATVVGGVASFKSGTEATISGAKVVVQGTAGLKLSCGGAEISMDSSSITFKGDLRIGAGSKISSTGAKIDITKG